MTESSASPLARWRYGIHPKAAGAQISALGRVELQLGEALRLEMVGAEPGGEDIVHLQYYITTDAGGWALWTSCARVDLAAREAIVQAMTPLRLGEP